MGLVSELRRRNVFRVAIAYVIIAWLMLQVGDTLAPALHLGEWVNTVLAFFLILGFPIALVFAWAFELTPEGLKKEKEVDRSQSITHVTGRKLDFAIIGLMAVGILYLVLDNYVLEQAPSKTADEVIQDATPPEGKIMLAVLPFENLSGDPEQEYFSDGLTEELIAQLGHLQRDRLGIIARTSVMYYKDKNKRVDEIGRELGVDYVLEGSVRRADDRVRITAQLIQISNQSQLWAESFERDFDDIFALQDEVAGGVSRTLKLELLPAEQARLRRVRPANADAYEAFLKGRYHDYRYDRDELMTAIEYYEAAIKSDPGYALAYAALAHVWDTLGWSEYISFSEADKKAWDYTRKAAELDPNLVEVEVLFAEDKFFKNWDWSGAEAGFRRAFELDQGSEMASWHYVICLHALGRFEEAMAVAERGLQHKPDSRWINEQLAYMYENLHQYERAIEQYKKTIRLAPQIISYHRNLGNLYADLGRDEEAVREYLGVRRLAGDSPERIQALWDAFTANGLRNYWEKRLEHLRDDAMRQDVSPIAFAEIYAMLGQKDQALKWVEKLKEAATREYISPRTFADIYTQLGENDQALAWLEKAYEQRNWRLTGLKVGRRWDPLRDDPRFQDLLLRMNFPD